MTSGNRVVPWHVTPSAPSLANRNNFTNNNDGPPRDFGKEQFIPDGPSFDQLCHKACRPTGFIHRIISRLQVRYLSLLQSHGGAEVKETLRGNNEAIGLLVALVCTIMATEIQEPMETCSKEYYCHVHGILSVLAFTVCIMTMCLAVLNFSYISQAGEETMCYLLVSRNMITVFHALVSAGAVFSLALSLLTVWSRVLSVNGKYSTVNMVACTAFLGGMVFCIGIWVYLDHEATNVARKRAKQVGIMSITKTDAMDGAAAAAAAVAPMRDPEFRTTTHQLSSPAVGN